jgi:hypothetical protein
MPALNEVEGSAVALGEARTLGKSPVSDLPVQPPRSPVTIRILATWAFFRSDPDKRE